MIIKPKVRDFICVTTHPSGCETHIREEIEYVKNSGKIQNGPKNVLVIGASTGYGLSSRIVPTYAWDANTIGVFYERPSTETRGGTAGWYNSYFFKKIATEDGHYAKNINGDAFSKDIKKKTADLIEKDRGKVDLIVYSLASPRRTDPETGEIYNSVIKPVGGTTFTSKSILTDKGKIVEATIEPATDEQVRGTIKVMGGEDWQLWINYLKDRGLLSEGFRTVAYSYVGPEQTWPVYKDGTIGKAKEHLDETARQITAQNEVLKGRAFVSVNKAVVTQASSAIPVVPLYIAILFKVMKRKGVHENIIQQIYRLYRDHLCGKQLAENLEDIRIRIDNLELEESVQEEVAKIWEKIDQENLDELADLKGYQKDFLQLFGFEYEGVDYEVDVEPHCDDPEVIQ